MKLLLIMVIATALAASGFALTITEAECFITSDPGQGSGTPIALTPDSAQTITGLLIPTTGLTTNRSHRLWLRYRSVEGPWSLAEAANFFLLQPPNIVYSGRTITHAEYWFDEQQATIVDIPDGGAVTYAALIPTSGLSLNASHKLSVRYYDNTGKLSGAEARYFFLHQDSAGSVSVFDITHIEYRFDNLAPVLVDVTDGTDVAFADSIVTAGLAVNTSHKLTIRYRDIRGFWSQGEARYFFLHQPAGGALAVFPISHVEYWFDDLPHTLLDIADAANVSFTQAIPHNLAAGPHFFRLRYRDTRGLLSQMESRPFFVWTGAAPHAAAYIAGMELWVNDDPGVGNGLQISFPADGTFDEATETVDTVLTGIPTGIHRMGVRFRDELGYWSPVLIDTFIVGPVLVIRTAGNDVRLDWIAELHDAPFRVYRANTWSGPFNEIAQTDSLFYTDAGAVSGAERRYYYVTWTNNGFSSFRLPRTPVRGQANQPGAAALRTY